MNINQIRTITIEAVTKGIDAAIASVKGLSAAEKAYAAQSQVTATVTDIGTKRTLSAADAYKRQTLAVVEGARAYDQYVRQLKIADQYMKQGGITAQEHAQRVTLLKDKYGEASQASKALSATTEKLGQVFVALGATLSIGAVVAFGKEVFTLAANMDEQAQQVGVSTEALQAYRAAMLQSGIAQDSADQILQKLTRSIGEATAAAGNQRSAFVELGISASDLAGGTESAMPKVAAALLQINDASSRARLEVDLFGKTGQKLESALTALIDPTATLIEKQKALGQVMGTDVTEAADHAADRLTEAWNGVKTGAAPGITWLIDKLADLVEWSNKFNDSIKNSWLSAPAFGLAGYGSQAEYDAANGPKKDTSFLGNLNQSKLLVNGHPLTSKPFSTENYDSVLAQLREQNDLIGKSAAEQAVLVKLREAEAAQIKDGNGALAESQKIEISRMAVVKANADAATKASMDRDAANKKEQEDIEKVENTISKLSSEYEAESRRIADRAVEQKKALDDYLQGLQDEVTLAGMTAVAREREAEAIQAARHGASLAQQDQARGYVAARQEAQRLQELQTPVEEFPIEVLESAACEISTSIEEIMQ